MSKEIQAAQKLFMEHSCNSKLMIDDGTIETYKKYNISVETENKWIELYKDNLIKNLHSTNDKKKIEYAKKLANITNRTNDYDCLLALFNETKEMYKSNDVTNVITMCEIIPSAINTMMLASNYLKVREIVIDIMDMLEILLRKDMSKDKPQKKEIRASLDINDIKNTLLHDK